MASSVSPPPVPMELFAQNRAKLVRSLRDHLASVSKPIHGFVLLQGGEEQTRYCTDHVDLFRQESYFAYLFGVREPGFYGAIDVSSGQSFLFAPRLPADYAVWLGEIKPTSYFKERYVVGKVFYVDEIVQVLHDHFGEPGKPLLFLLYGLNTDSDKFSKPAELEVMRKIRSGMKEYQLESIFLHHTYMYGGCRHWSYVCICATGENSAVLHYGHAAAPNDRTLTDGDMALFDMGAEYNFYGSDITCSFPVNGKFTKEQIVIYNAVLDAHDAVISSMHPGVGWIDMHKLAEKTILESLKKAGIMVGDVDDMMTNRIGAVFMPHGLGHLLGIDTHDPGGYAKGMERPKEPGLKSLRTIRELKEGMVITVEPGCYFIDALLTPALEDSTTSKFFNREEVIKYKNFGGVRIESDLYVMANGCKNLTNCPRKTSEIEAVMAGAPWPLNSDSSRIKTENGPS